MVTLFHVFLSRDFGCEPLVTVSALIVGDIGVMTFKVSGSVGPLGRNVAALETNPVPVSALEDAADVAYKNHSPISKSRVSGAYG